MALLNILKEPDPLLRQKSIDVDINENYNDFLNDLMETMIANRGIGIAAPQVGVFKRIFIMSIPTDTGFVRRNVINPIILLQSQDKIECEEGCLSVEKLRFKVKRSAEIKVKYLNEKSEIIIEKLTGLDSICFQHEFDHLDGILFIDRVSAFKKNMFSSNKRRVSR